MKQSPFSVAKPTSAAMKVSQVALAAFGFATVPHRVVASNVQQTAPLSQRDAMPPWKTLGCYVDKNALQNRSTKAKSTFLSIGMCEDACFTEGYQYAGVKGGLECWCGTYVGSSRTENQGDCDIPCPGYAVDMCGGIQAFNIFEAQTGSKSTALPAPTGSSSSSTSNSSVISSSTSGVSTAASTPATTTPSSQSSQPPQPTVQTGNAGLHSTLEMLSWVAVGLVWLGLEL